MAQGLVGDDLIHDARQNHNRKVGGGRMRAHEGLAAGAVRQGEVQQQNVERVVGRPLGLGPAHGAGDLDSLDGRVGERLPEQLSIRIAVFD